MKNTLNHLLLTLSIACASSLAAQATPPPPQQLVVFEQPQASELASKFQREKLTKIKALAEEAGIAFQRIDVSELDGLPAQVGITPLIVYQNHRGRSIYQGRYETLDRVSNFIRTSRFMPQGSDPLVREDLGVWDLGRAKVATPIKITDLAGQTPDGFDQDAFMAEAKAAMALADERFEFQSRVELGRSDRMFYTDFHPYRSKDGKLFLSLAIFSQFHCHDPVFTSNGEVSGSWEDRDKVFAEGYARMTGEIARLLAESDLGDGFDPVPATTPDTTWEAIGLTLPPKPDNAVSAGAANVELVGKWQIDAKALKERPAVQFTFPAPLDSYSGEATDITGNLTLGEGFTLPKTTGTIHADPTSVTMGEPDLDSAIHSDMLNVAEHPKSFFTIESITAEPAPLTYGQVAAAQLHGKFTMKGITIPLTVPASIEAFIAEDGKPRLSLSGKWEIRLMNPFGISGPPGKAPANDTLVYTCYFVFEPAQAASDQSDLDL